MSNTKAPQELDFVMLNEHGNSVTIASRGDKVIEQTLAGNKTGLVSVLQGPPALMKMALGSVPDDQVRAFYENAVVKMQDGARRSLIQLLEEHGII